MKARDSIASAREGRSPLGAARFGTAVPKQFQPLLVLFKGRKSPPSGRLCPS